MEERGKTFLPAAVILVITGAFFSGRFGVVVAIVRTVSSAVGVGKAPSKAA